MHAFPVDVMIEPVAASAAPPERLELRSPHTSVLLSASLHVQASHRTWPRLQSAGSAWADPAIPPTAPVVSLVLASGHGLVLLRPRGLSIRVRSSYVSEWMCRPL